MVASRRVHDPKVLRAISHPTRNRILTELTAGGPMRAADLAAELGIPANQASFHLRQLAKYGLISEDPDAARDRRDRVWRAEGLEGLEINIDQLQREPGGRAAASVFLRTSADWVHHVVDLAHSADRGAGGKRSTSENAIRLTEEEAGQLVDELQALLASWVERNRGRDPERTTYLVHTMLLPYPDLPPPAEEG